MGVDVYAHIGFGITWNADDVDASQIDDDLYEENLVGNLKNVYSSWHGSDDYRNLVLIAKGSFDSVEWESKVIDHMFPLDLPENRERWSQELKVACEWLGLEYKEPHWLLWTRMW